MLIRSIPSIITVEGTHPGGNDVLRGCAFMSFSIHCMLLHLLLSLYWDGHHMLQVLVAVLCTAHMHDL